MLKSVGSKTNFWTWNWDDCQQEILMIATTLFALDTALQFAASIAFTKAALTFAIATSKWCKKCQINSRGSLWHLGAILVQNLPDTGCTAANLLQPVLHLRRKETFSPTNSKSKINHHLGELLVWFPSRIGQSSVNDILIKKHGKHADLKNMTNLRVKSAARCFLPSPTNTTLLKT